MSRQITKAEYSGKQTEGLFLEDYREIVAFHSGVTEGIVAYLQLNNVEELIALSQAPNPRLYRRLLAEALVTLIDRGALTQVAELNDLAERDLEKLRKETGIYPEGYLAPPPPPRQLSAQEQLEQRVSDDWNSLKIADFKKNCANDKTYRETFERLSEENRLGGNTATSLQRAGA
jgi:hypothetical protein